MRQLTHAYAYVCTRTCTVCEMKSYRHYVLRRLLKLESLDGRPVSEAEQQAAMANTSSIKASMIKENAFVQRRSNWSPLPAYTHTHTHTHTQFATVDYLPGYSQQSSKRSAWMHTCIPRLSRPSCDAARGADHGWGGGQVPNPCNLSALSISISISIYLHARARAHTHTHTHTHTHRSLLPAHLRRQQLADKESLDNGDADDESWWEKVQDLELNNRHLRKLSNLERLVNLKVLSVCDNEILAIQGLERWVACVRSRRVCLGMCVCVCVCVCVVRIIRCHRCAARTWASICLVCAHPRTGRARAHTHTHTTPRMGVCSSTHACAHSNTCIRTAVCCWRSY